MDIDTLENINSDVEVEIEEKKTNGRSIDELEAFIVSIKGQPGFYLFRDYTPYTDGSHPELIGPVVAIRYDGRNGLGILDPWGLMSKILKCQFFQGVLASPEEFIYFEPDSDLKYLQYLKHPGLFIDIKSPNGGPPGPMSSDCIYTQNNSDDIIITFHKYEITSESIIEVLSRMESSFGMKDGTVKDFQFVLFLKYFERFNMELSAIETATLFHYMNLRISYKMYYLDSQNRMMFLFGGTGDNSDIFRYFVDQIAEAYKQPQYEMLKMVTNHSVNITKFERLIPHLISLANDPNCFEEMLYLYKSLK